MPNHITNIVAVSGDESRIKTMLKAIQTDEYGFRVWLLNLGLIGEEYKNCRMHLLSHLSGNIAWRHPEDAIAQRERLKQKRIAAREQRIEPVSEVREQSGNVPDESVQAAVSDPDDSLDEDEEIGMDMAM